MKLKLEFTMILAITIISCNRKNSELITITNELSYCEESSVFCKIVNDSNLVNLKKRGISETVFLKFDKNLRDSNYYKLFFPSIHTLRYKAKVEGDFESSKLYDDTYGCLGSSIFKVIKVISFEDVTAKDTFEINYLEK
jgi:hypothetical protein